MRQTISAWRKERRRGRGGSPSPGRRLLLWAVGVSIAVHVVAALLVVFLPRQLTADPHIQEQGTVELLMVEQKGAQPRVASQPSPPPQPQPQPKAEPPKRPDQAQPAAEPPRPIPPVSDKAAEPAPRPPEEPPKKAATAGDHPPPPSPSPPHPSSPHPPPQETPPPSPPTSQKAPVFNLAGTESESNAIALGSRILPASPDNRFRNRPPIYPAEAEMRGEHGTVVVVIHVSDAGLAAGVDVTESSGVPALDKAAVDAVRKWRFRPAMQAGRTIPFDMPIRFVFKGD